MGPSLAHAVTSHQRSARDNSRFGRLPNSQDGCSGLHGEVSESEVSVPATRGIYSGGRGGCSTQWPQGDRPTEGRKGIESKYGE